MRVRKEVAMCVVLGLVAVFALWPFPVRGEDSAGKRAQTKCPVMGGDIDKNVYVDYQGQRIYFCCAGCPATFKRNPEKVFAKIAEQNVLLESVQKVCPVSGEPINKEFYTDYKGRRVYFCGKECVAPFEKSPEKYLMKMIERTSLGEGEEKGSGHEHGKGDGHQHSGGGCGGGCR